MANFSKMAKISQRGSSHGEQLVAKRLTLGDDGEGEDEEGDDGKGEDGEGEDGDTYLQQREGEGVGAWWWCRERQPAPTSRPSKGKPSTGAGMHLRFCGKHWVGSKES